MQESLWRGLSQDLRNLPIRTCARSCKDILEDVRKFFTRSSHKDGPQQNHKFNIRTCTKSCRDFWNSSHITDLQGCAMKRAQDGYRRAFPRTHETSWPGLTESAIICTAPLSDPTRTKCRERCAIDIKSRTVPQRERSDRREVLRGLREPCQNSHRATTRAIRCAQNAEMVARRYQNSHRATTRAIWRAQSHERVAGAHVRFSQNIARTKNVF